MNNRTQTADLLKGIAALLMIQVHIIELFATQNIFDSTIGKVLLFLGGPPVAPVFIVIFGYFIAESKKTTIQLIGRGLKIILLGLFLNIALNLNLIISVNKGIFDIDIWPYILGVDILPLAGLSLIIIALFSPFWRINKSVIIFSLLALIFISAFLGNFLLDYTPQQPLLKYLFSPFYGASTWSYFPLFPWLSYSLAGITFFKIKELWKPLLTSPKGRNESSLSTRFGFLSWLSSPWGRAGGAFFFLLFLTFSIQYAITISSDIQPGMEGKQEYYHHGLIFFLWVITFLSFYSFFINEIEKKFGTTVVFRYIKWIGKNITVVYIIQWIIIGNIATEIYKTVSVPSYLLICFIAVSAISSGICYLWVKIKGRLIKKTI